jgi:GTP cyclohydrolase I
MKDDRRGTLTEAPEAAAPPTPERIAEIAEHFRTIIRLLGLDLSDPNLVETPERVAKMYFELFQGLSEGAEPKVTFFPNDERYTAMVMEKDIPFYSLCSHHFVPFYGTCTSPTSRTSRSSGCRRWRGSSSSTRAGRSCRSG